MISILLACYNGEKYISEQIKSLLSQTVQDFKLIICDDASTDSTFEIISELANNNPGRIEIYHNEENSGGAKHNFIKMMIRHKDDYLMLCDHDDVWLPKKIEVTLAIMRKMEAEHGTQTPILVHTDLRVVNENLVTISPSYKKAMNSNFNKTKLRNQIIQNTLTGCTAMYNRALANLITEAPPYMVMHDWWLMLVASAFGRIDSLDEQTILYRQHSNNEIGAKDVRTVRNAIIQLLQYKTIKEALKAAFLQADCFLKIYKTRLNDEQRALLKAFCNIPNYGKIKRCASLCHLGTLKNGLYRKIACLLFI